MAINYAEKYSNKVDERFSQSSITQSAFNQEYDWEGVATVKVYSVSTAPLNSYKMTGSNRYGTPDELGTNIQPLTLTQDQSFTFTIDKRNNTDTMAVLEAGKALRRQVDEIIVPTVDKYRLAALVAGAGNTATAPITGAYDTFLTGVAVLKDSKAPTAGTFAFISSGFYKAIRKDDAFIKSGDLSQKMLISGQVGEVEGIPLIFAYADLLPAGVEFILTNKIAAIAPVKLTEYKTHDNPPGINGWLVEGRIYYDTFVLNNKSNAIYVHKSV